MHIGAFPVQPPVRASHTLSSFPSSLKPGLQVYVATELALRSGTVTIPF